jgi:preprotein translocase subunit YajC
MIRKTIILTALASAATSFPVAAQVASDTEAQTPTMEPAEDSTRIGTETAAGQDAAAEAATPADSGADAAAATGTGATATASTATAATAADVKAGATVVDQQGGTVGTIESVDANGAVISTGKARVQIPVTSFAKNERGLVISLTKAQLEAEASKPSA